MSKFSVVISQHKTDMGDSAIHLREEGKPEKLLAHIKLTDLSFLDEPVIDELVGGLARKLFKRITEHRACGNKEPEWEDWQESRARMEAKRIILSLGMPLATSEGYRK